MERPRSHGWLALGFLLGTTATWLGATWAAAPLEGRGLVIAGALSLGGGVLAGFGLARLAWTGWRVGASLGTAAMLGAWVLGVRLLLGGAVGPFTAGRAPVWLVLLVLTIVEARLFSGGRSR